MDDLRILILDLDDTLYPESSFVESGLRAVSAYLEEFCAVKSDDSMQFMLDTLKKDGRGRIFNAVRSRFSVTTVSVRSLVSIYRAHSPNISLSMEARDLLLDLPNFLVKKPYLVTDGNLRVQRSKIKALDISHFFERTYCTKQFGAQAEKPNLKVFRHIADRESVDFSSLIYVGDDPNKDFHRIVEAGGTAIRVKTGRFGQVENLHEPKPQFEISSLAQLREILFDQSTQ
jgi:putative hydrolase of the HAD superfamily